MHLCHLYVKGIMTEARTKRSAVKQLHSLYSTALTIVLLTLCCGSRRIRMVVLRSHRTVIPSEASTARYIPIRLIVYLISEPIARSNISWVPFANLISLFWNEQYNVSTNSYPLKCIHYIWYYFETQSSICLQWGPTPSWILTDLEQVVPVVPHGIFSVVTRKMSSTDLLPHLFLKKELNITTTLTPMLVFTENPHDRVE